MELLLSGGDAKSGTEEAEAVAAAIDSLTVKDGEKGADEVTKESSDK